MSLKTSQLLRGKASFAGIARAIAAFAAVGLAACGAVERAPEISLRKLEPLTGQRASATVPLRVAVASVVSPQGTVQSYQPLLDYLGRSLNRPVELVQRRTYAETNDLVESGDVDLAFVCTSAYVEGNVKFGMELLVAPQVGGRSVYYSVLIVPADSTADSMADLRDKVFAFTDPMSLSGRVYPTALVRELGTTPERFFRRTFFTYSHDDAIRAVADKVADAAAVDSMVLDFALSREPALAAKLRSIHISPPFGIPPVVVSPKARPQLRAELQTLILDLDPADPADAVVLQSIGVEQFVEISDKAYDSVRALLALTPP